jgi:hypothetical protein
MHALVIIATLTTVSALLRRNLCRVRSIIGECFLLSCLYYCAVPSDLFPGRERFYLFNPATDFTDAVENGSAKFVIEAFLAKLVVEEPV